MFNPQLKEWFLSQTAILLVLSQKHYDGKGQKPDNRVIHTTKNTAEIIHQTRPFFASTFVAGEVSMKRRAKS